jgi:hypothetical protein
LDDYFSQFRACPAIAVESGEGGMKLTKLNRACGAIAAIISISNLIYGSSSD